MAPGLVVLLLLVIAIMAMGLAASSAASSSLAFVPHGRPRSLGFAVTPRGAGCEVHGEGLPLRGLDSTLESLPKHGAAAAALVAGLSSIFARRHRSWREHAESVAGSKLLGPGKEQKRAHIAAAAAGSASTASSVGVVLLSAGVGKRMGAKIPKQYLKLCGLEIALHSLDVFLDCNVTEIAIVCAEEYRSIFQEHLEKRGGTMPVIKYTVGGKERQDSVQNGLAEISAEFVAVHDAARPLVTQAEVEKVIADAQKYGAALLSVPTKATIKQAFEGKGGETLVDMTPNRKLLWEAHTPQVIRADLLRQGFENAASKNLAVTDDVSLVEALGEPVKLTEGEYTNIKVTTPEDIAVAETILRERGFTG
mmetsp:Transcript_60313/g.166952  ORF Transcript_60313/g.166952 Transcript_60313/m.166952 type:complete len:365 (+) Transcript_60313:63-1157(+)